MKSFVYEKIIETKRGLSWEYVEECEQMIGKLFNICYKLCVIEELNLPIKYLDIIKKFEAINNKRPNF